MTDNEIKKALECLTRASKLCKEYGHYHFCRENCTKDALDLINRYGAKIEILKEEKEKLQGDLIEERTRRENAVNAYHELAAENKKLEAEIVMIQKESELLKSRNTIMDRAIAKARAEAIKEFAERLKKEMAYCSAETDEMIIFETEFDDLVKEMTEGKE